MTKRQWLIFVGIIALLIAAFFFLTGQRSGVSSARAAFSQIIAARTLSRGTAPTATVTGAGTTATVATGTGSTDSAGVLTITSAGTGQAALGTLTLTFSTPLGAYGATAPVACVATLHEGTGDWNVRATIRGDNTSSTTAHVFNWDNNAVAVVAASTYSVAYQCTGR